MSAHIQAVRALQRRAVRQRPFHTPFASLRTPTPAAPPPITYDKAADPTPDPDALFAGPRTYVVSEPDPANTHHSVPCGAFPTSAPYTSFPATAAPEQIPADQLSSTSSNPRAHPITAGAAQHTGGVGLSAAVRNASAPGQMGAQGGGYGGSGLPDEKGTTKASGLASRNPPPIGDVVEGMSKAGVDNAWKNRK